MSYIGGRECDEKESCVPFLLMTLLGLFLSLFIVEPAFGVETCGQRDKIVKQLAEQYGEKIIGQGIPNIGNGRRVVEMLASPDGATWTTIVVWPNGYACLMAAGTDWQPYPLPIRGEKS